MSPSGDTALEIEEGHEGIYFRVLLQPRAKATGVVGVHGGALKIRVAAPPVDQKANRELLAFLADLLGIAKGRVELVGGQTARIKRLLVLGMSRTEFLQKMGVS
jgi:uncharacterized protein